MKAAREVSIQPVINYNPPRLILSTVTAVGQTNGDVGDEQTLCGKAGGLDSTPVGCSGQWLKRGTDRDRGDRVEWLRGNAAWECSWRASFHGAGVRSQMRGGDELGVFG
jgi:hypothetical protein